MIGATIRRIREQSKKHMGDVAEYAGVSVVQISDFELDKGVVPQEVFRKICDYLDVDRKVVDAWDDLLYGLSPEQRMKEFLTSVVPANTGEGEED